MEPFFTFEARVPPYELPKLTVRQVRAHLLWWENNHGSLEFHKDRG